MQIINRSWLQFSSYTGEICGMEFQGQRIPGDPDRIYFSQAWEDSMWLREIRSINSSTPNWDVELMKFVNNLEWFDGCIRAAIEEGKIYGWNPEDVYFVLSEQELQKLQEKTIWYLSPGIWGASEIKKIMGEEEAKSVLVSLAELPYGLYQL